MLDVAVETVQLVGRKEAWLSITHDELLLPVKWRRTEACERAEASELVKSFAEASTPLRSSALT